MSEAFKTEIVEREGAHFKIEFFYDNDQGRPWEESDGHGRVREARRRHASTTYDGEKRAGEIPLNDPDRNEYQFFYDWQEAVATARKEWGIGDEELAKLTAKLGRQPTKGEIAVQAVKQDIKYLRGWLNDSWCYVGITVTRVTLDEDEEEVIEEHEEHSVWGFETLEDYHLKGAEEVLSDVMREYKETLKKEAEEAAERQFWEERDVVTA